MAEPPDKRYPAASWFFGVGLGGFAVWFAVVTVFGLGAANLAPGFVLLGLCVPALWIAIATGLTGRPSAWERHGRDAMARVTSVEESGRDEVGDPYYDITATLLPDGRRVTIQGYQYPSRHEAAMRELAVLPVRYLPETGLARIRTELVERVLECEDPRAGQP